MLRYLRDLAARSARPLVVLFDEVDGFIGEAMVSFLTQLRQGYLDRSRTPFPASVVLIGQRQVRDYALALEDLRKERSWDERLFVRDAGHAGKRVRIVGC